MQRVRCAKPPARAGRKRRHPGHSIPKRASPAAAAGNAVWSAVIRDTKQALLPDSTQHSHHMHRIAGRIPGSAGLQQRMRRMHGRILI